MRTQRTGKLRVLVPEPFGPAGMCVLVAEPAPVGPTKGVSVCGSAGSVSATPIETIKGRRWLVAEGGVRLNSYSLTCGIQFG